MHPPDRPRETEDILVDVVHDIRQPLSTIETSVIILSLLLGDSSGPGMEYLRTIERQVELASNRLDEAVAELRQLRSLPPHGRSLAFEESERAVIR